MMGVGYVVVQPGGIKARDQRAFPVVANAPGDSPAGDPGTIL